MVFYIDDDYKIHLTNPDNTYEKIESDIDFFEGKCEQFIEGFRFVPKGRTWVRWDQEEFPGEMISPWTDIMYLDRAQAEYVQNQLDDAIAAFGLLGIV
jgi:hypothetical protein